MSGNATSLLRVQNFMLSRDGFGTGEGQSVERPFGHADPAVLAAWAGATASWPNRSDGGGTRGLDDYFTRDFHHNIGAEIMGRGKFGPQTGRWADLEWTGWWGGASTVREFLDADLIDTMHVAVVDIELGRGGKLWDSPDELLDRFHLERIPSPSGVTHHIFWRR